MNRITRSLTIAAPLAVAALAMTPAAANADDGGSIVQLTPALPSTPMPPSGGPIYPVYPQPLTPVIPTPVIPTPVLPTPDPGPLQPFDPGSLTNPIPVPLQPVDPGDLTNPTDDPTDPPTGPGDLTNPTDEPTDPPTGPGDLTNPQPCPTHGDCGGDNGGGDNGGGDNGGGDKGHHSTSDVPVPTRVDAGEASAPSAGLTGHNDLALSWVLAGGALVTASGAAFAAGRRRRSSL